MLERRTVYAKLPAQDVPRAKRFYAEKLGLEPYRELNNHLWYETGGAHFIVFPSSGRPSGTHDQMGFVVDDVPRAVEALKARGVHFRDVEMPGIKVENGIMDRGYMKAAWFEDSEGNLLSIAQFANSPLHESGSLTGVVATT